MPKILETKREQMKNFYLKRLVVNSLLILFLYSMIFVLFRELRTTIIFHERSLNCSHGLQFDSFTRKCIDINECHEFKCTICRNLICENLIGSYQCHRPKCPSGYKIHASYKTTHINKCVRMRCPKHNRQCRRLPKYKIFKHFSISPAMEVRSDGSALLHEIFTERLTEGTTVEIETHKCISGRNFGLAHRGHVILVLLKYPLDLIKYCRHKEQLIKINIRSKKSGKILEIIEIKAFLKNL